MHRGSSGERGCHLPSKLSTSCLLPLQGYEIPRDFIVELDPFSKDNHLLTDSGKPARGKLKAKCAQHMLASPVLHAPMLPPRHKRVCC